MTRQQRHAGFYRLVPNKEVNGMPVWRNGRMWLYSSTSGIWTFAFEDEDTGMDKAFATGAGGIFSAAHGGLTPDAVTGWKSWDGNKHQEDAGISVTSDCDSGAAAAGDASGHGRGACAATCACAAATAPAQAIPARSLACVSRATCSHAVSSPPAVYLRPVQAHPLCTSGAAGRVADPASDVRRAVPSPPKARGERHAGVGMRRETCVFV
eukprot:gene19617-biopygen5198